MFYAELHLQMVPWGALAQPVVCPVAVSLDQLLLLADGRAALTGFAPVPVFGEVPLGAGGAGGGGVLATVL